MAIEYVDARARGLRPRRAREHSGAVALARRIDWLLLGAVGALIAYGLWAVAGITRYDVPGDPHHFVIRQGIAVAVGAVGLLLALAVDLEIVRRYRQLLYGGTVALMVLVLVMGAATRGSRRWIDLGFFQFQPSEFGKVLVTIFLAGILADRAKRIHETGTVLAVVGAAIPPMFLVFVQPDLGTSLVYGAALFAVLFVGGVRWLHLAVLGVLLVAAAAAVLWFLPNVAGVQVLKDYQSARLTGFANPNIDPSGTTYNVNQSITAVGAGGCCGRGVEGATQTRLEFLPEHETDFVFAALAEQRGFIGAAILLLLYLLVVWRGLKVIAIAPSLFSAVVAGGIVFALLFQIFVNVGMTIRVAPVTGIPLPFVSVGGSSMATNLIAVGLLLGIYARGRAAGRRA